MTTPQDVLDAQARLRSMQGNGDGGAPADVRAAVGQQLGGTTVGPRTPSIDEVIRIMQDRQSGLSTVGQAVRALPEPMRNTVASTITTLAGVPFGIADLPHLAARGIDWSTDQLNRLAGISTPEYRTNLAAHIPPSGSVMTQEAMRRLGLEPTIADTTTGRIAQGALGGAVGGATLGGGIGPTVARGAGVAPTAMRGGQLGLAGGLASEVAGEATRGTPYELPARLAAGILLPSMAALEQGRIGGAARTMGRAIDITPPQLAHAQRLLDDARAGGHPLTVPEALAQAGVSGAGRLLVMQRLAEQQGEGAGRTLGAFRQYQAQNAEQAINDIANRIAPPVADPYELGRRVQGAAGGVVNEARTARTQASQQAGYTVANPTPLPPDAVGPIVARITHMRDVADGGVARTSSLYGEMTATINQLLEEATIPNTTLTVGRVDDIFKQLRDRIADAGQPNATPGLRRDAGRLGPGVQAIHEELLNNPDYAAGSRTHAQMSPRVTAIEEGLPGRIAATDDPQKQSALLMGRNARPGTVTDTLTNMQTARAPLSGHVDAQAVSDIVRLQIDNALGDVPRFQGIVPREQLGAKFNALIRTDPMAAANFTAALRTVPNGTATLDQLNRLLDVFEAQGRRLNVGSPTDVNAVLRGTLTGHTANVLPVTRIPALIQRGIDQWSYGRRLQDIADVSTSPTGLLDIQRGARQRSAIPRGLLAADAVTIQRALEEERRARQP